MQFLKNRCFYLRLTLLLFLFNSNGLARVHEYETTRLKSTAGAGVASLLVDEATVLNPASLAFFNLSAAYLQRYATTHTIDKKIFSLKGREDDKKSYGLILSDTKSALKGSLSYFTQNEANDSRKRFSASFGSNIGEKSAFGMTVRHTMDHDLKKRSKKKYQQMVFGALHVISQGLSFGITVIDPLKKVEGDSRLILGGQYVFSNIMSIMLDTGANFYEGLVETLILRGAVQVNFFSDLYFRLGLFRDKALEEKGEGMGVSWISPRLVFDAAVKTTRPLLSQIRPFRELSFSISYRF